MKLTREDALKYHRQMWSDMQNELGDRPNAAQRLRFKRKWCEKHFPSENISANCFLCEYTTGYCSRCPIKWNGGCHSNTCEGDGVNYLFSPISVILALPERKLSDE